MLGYVTENQIADAMTTAHLWQLAEKRVLPIALEYFRGAADESQALRGNVRALQSQFLAPPGAVKHSRIDSSTSLFGQELKVPYFFCPLGSLRTLCPMADAVAARVASESGTAFTLSTLSQTPMNAVAEAGDGPKWFQLYLCGGRESSIERIKLAKELGFSVLILTIDTAVAGNRYVHNRMKPMDAIDPVFFRQDNSPSNSKPSPRQMLNRAWRKITLVPQVAMHLPWLASHMADGGTQPFVNIVVDGKAMPYAGIGEQLAASAVTWKDIEWIRDHWDGPLVFKGAHCLEDVLEAQKLDAAGVIFSNHGGRQLGRAIPALQIAAEVMPEVKRRGIEMDFAMDGGIRSGADVAIALSLGLKAVGIGRVMAAGLGAGGYLGLKRAVSIMNEGLNREMELCGFQNVAEIRENGIKILRRNEFLYPCDLPEFVF